MTSALLSPDTITTPAATDHACCCKQCGRLWTDSLSNLESDGSPTTVGRLRRKTGEKIESLLETIRDSYLQIDDFLSYIYENRDTRQHRKRWRQLERWFMGSVDKGRFGSNVLKSWLLQGGGETIFGIYQAKLDTLFKTTAFGRFNIHGWSVESTTTATEALQSLGPTVKTQAPLSYRTR